MSTMKRLWRWRSNPLRRHEDVVEAWVVLTVWVVVAVAGAFAGLVTARSAEHEFAQQRAHRHTVRALKAGAPVTVWLDDRGRLTLSPPTGRVEGHVEAALFGVSAVLAVAAPVLGAGAFARARLDRRRMARWDREWDLVGPQWGPRTG
jgi:hypothetical protein